jgi:hypothetical protein
MGQTTESKMVDAILSKAAGNLGLAVGHVIKKLDAKVVTAVQELYSLCRELASEFTALADQIKLDGKEFEMREFGPPFGFPTTHHSACMAYEELVIIRSTRRLIAERITDQTDRHRPTAPTTQPLRSMPTTTGTRAAAKSRGKK